MNKYFEYAQSLKEKIINFRRDLHQIPELGLELPKTKEYIVKELEKLNLEPIFYGDSGISALIKGEKGEGKTLLIRGDMDALPMAEDNDLDFQATGETAHTCGHDFHMAWLLGAAKILVDHKEDFKGNVKLMFQPAEEIFAGAKMMIDEGILENPKVDAALAMHTNLEDEPGSLSYNYGYVSTSSDNFEITIEGKGGHGAFPHTTIDPIGAGVEIYEAFNALIARENPPTVTTVLTFGEFAAGSNSNIIPHTARLQGTLRTFDPETRDYIKNRMAEVIEGIEKTTRTNIDLNFFTGISSIYSDPEITEEFIKILNNKAPEIETRKDMKLMASEDMSLVSEKVPTAYFMFNCKVPGINTSHHHPGVLFNEEALDLAAGSMATIAVEWLNNN